MRGHHHGTAAAISWKSCMIPSAVTGRGCRLKLVDQRHLRIVQQGHEPAKALLFCRRPTVRTAFCSFLHSPRSFWAASTWSIRSRFRFRASAVAFMT